MPSATSNSEGTKSAISSERPRVRVLRHVQEQIENGNWKPGQVLPSTLQLARSLRVDWETVHAALETLQADGVLRAGSGRLRLVAAANAQHQSLLSNTLIVLSQNPENAPGESSSGGRPQCVDEGAWEEARRQGLNHLAFHPSRLLEDEFEQIVSAGPRGLVVTDLFGDWEDALAKMAALAERRVVVAVYGDAPAAAGLDRVLSDYEAGCYAMTRWLIAQGRRRILIMGPQREFYWIQGRLAGFERAHHETHQISAGVLRLPSVVTVGNSRVQWEAQVRMIAGYLLEYFQTPQPVDAIIAASDAEVPMVSAACRLLGRTPNQDVALAGYDHSWSDYEASQWEAVPPLVSVDKNNRQVGAELVKLLQERVAGTLPPQPQKRLIQPQLVFPA